MPVLDLSSEVLEFFDYVEGKTPTKKILNLVKADLSKRLRECEEEIFEFEVKYKLSFPEFEKAWEKGEIKRKYSHGVERDYIVWEGLEAERKKWLGLMKKFK